ncbi:Cu(I)/Ag(I) efflux system membrane fusion protein [Flavobacterium croceum DSM 17960]|uniref:Cu(I)/Ag(I) efflux system membrane fusion protein n=1 Tax=Flavobacterium croceum DSM 17960 TaxID=1121886 RepID=A0A2S4N970_9FLAO|nr:efflux RND transporter periplasmic adaptor subunit [Flavobacterium croceum]POS02242.1 Cu(I)/Ag(I) efflux system membrane fusion protein [Flavobacterium croceum DSM 17960]
MNKYIKYGLILGAIAIIGSAIYFYVIKPEVHDASSHQNVVYTCSMHPQIIRDKPGNCPICGMTLVKKVTDNHSNEDHNIDNVIKPTDNFVVGKFQTTTAVDSTISGEINLPGIIAYDPNSAINIAAKISGRIEKIYVNFKYQRISKGQKLFDLYSPELLTEQENFIYLLSNDSDNRPIIEASKQKLLLYGMTQNQINALANSKKANPKLAIFSPSNGIVMGTETMDASSNSGMQSINSSTEKLDLKEGSYVKKGEVVFKLVNTDKVWGIFNIAQESSSLIKVNQAIKITSELNEENSIEAKINFIEIQFNAADKTNRIRVYLNNNTLKLPIGLRLQGVIKTRSINSVWVQKDALVSTGNKKIAFIKSQNGFKAIPVKTGFEMNGYIQIIDGISVKDTIAKNAQYLIDSESFIKTE